MAVEKSFYREQYLNGTRHNNFENSLGWTTMLYHDRHDLFSYNNQLLYVRICIDNLDGMNNGNWRNLGIVFTHVRHVGKYQT